MIKRKYLLKKDEPDIRDKQFERISKFVKLPDKIDLRKKMPPIVDQGQVGSCQTCAILAIDQYVIGYKWVPSIPYGYYNLHTVERKNPEEDCGGTLRDTIKATVKYGVCNSKIWPNSHNFYDIPSPKAYEDGLAGDDKLHSYYRIKNMPELKKALAQGHLPYIGIRVYESFETEECMKTGLIPAPAGKALGGHALVIVGYNKHDFIIRNSWGTSVGDKGYFYCMEPVLEKLLMDAWIIVK